MLRASSKAENRAVNPRGILPGVAECVGVEHEAILMAFADAVVGEDGQALQQARAGLLEAMGPAALVDASAVAGNFQRMNRIADACGIALGRLQAMISDIRAELDIEYFPSARNADGVQAG